MLKSRTSSQGIRFRPQGYPAAPARLCPGTDPRSRPRRRSGPADRREGAGRPQVVSSRNEFRRMAVPHSAQRVHLGPAPSAPNRVLRRYLHQYPFPSAPSGERPGHARVHGRLPPPGARHPPGSPARGGRGPFVQADRHTRGNLGRHGEKPHLARSRGASQISRTNRRASDPPLPMQNAAKPRSSRSPHDRPPRP